MATHKIASNDNLFFSLKKKNKKNKHPIVADCLIMATSDYRLVVLQTYSIGSSKPLKKAQSGLFCCNFVSFRKIIIMAK